MKPSPNSPPPTGDDAGARGMPAGRGWAVLLLNWLVPGLGFWLCGRRARAAIQFLMVIVTFAIGVGLRGGVDWPSWSFDSPDFNLINNFTFIIQLGAGIPSLLSLLANELQSLLGLFFKSLETGLPALILHAADTLHLTFLAGVPTKPYYELGQYYMIVAGAINYFATCNLHDRIVHPHAKFAAQEGLEETERSEKP